MSRIRIGIDVGGTFTHAVAVDTENFQLLGHAMVPTTHRAAEGVAAGIIASLRLLLEKTGIAPGVIVLIAHSTTQATNALLEGDVAKAGILGMGTGLEGMRAKSETQLGKIELAPGRLLSSCHRFVDTANDFSREKIKAALEELRHDGAEVIVASEAFSVDDPSRELLALEVAQALNLPATAAHQISQLYGLQMRTRTAAINASMLPVMMNTARMTEEAVQRASIAAPLMIMRSDGGVMDLAGMRQRPILTMLSGPAAGVAAALMYVRISDGIFIEVGGTSTDISAIRHGKPLVRSAQVGGHKLYLRTLDVRTLGIAGGSMIRIRDGEIIDVGPRSAHIAGLPYEAFADPANLKSAQLEFISPRAGDPADYAILAGRDGQRFALTTTGAANFLGLVPASDHAFGNHHAITAAYEILAQALKKPAAKIAEQILDCAAAKVTRVVDALLQDNELERSTVVLVGGGGGAAAIVPFVAKKMKMDFRLAENNAVISAIGVALAMVQDTIERTVVNPTEADLVKIRHEAEESVRRMGADPATIEVQVEVDTRQHRVRAIAAGSTELRQRDLAARELDETARREIARRALAAKEASLRKLVTTRHYEIFAAEQQERKLLGLARIRRQALRVIDREGVIRLALADGRAFTAQAATVLSRLEEFLQEHTRYGDAGARIPQIFILSGGRIFNFSSLSDERQVMALAALELKRVPENEEVVILGDLA